MTLVSEKKETVKEHIEDSDAATLAIRRMTQAISLSVGMAVVNALVELVPDLQTIALATLPGWAGPLAVTGIAAVVAALGSSAKKQTKNAVTVALYTPAPGEKSEQ